MDENDVSGYINISTELPDLYLTEIIIDKEMNHVFIIFMNPFLNRYTKVFACNVETDEKIEIEFTLGQWLGVREGDKGYLHLGQVEDAGSWVVDSYCGEQGFFLNGEFGRIAVKADSLVEVYDKRNFHCKK